MQFFQGAFLIYDMQKKHYAIFNGKFLFVYIYALFGGYGA